MSTEALVEVMARYGVDALVLGREAHARAVARTRRLWLAGTRAFAPGCVVVRDPHSVSVLANSDDAVPPGFPRERLFPITWNPEKLAAALAAIPGFGDCRCIGVDGMTPMMHGLLARVAPAAALVDATPLLAALWALPDPRRVDGVRAAAKVTLRGLAAMVDALKPGARPRVLRGVCAQAFASLGVTTPAFEAVVAPLGARHSTWLAPERLLAPGERVVVRAGALVDGWEASVARTYTVASDAPVAVAPGTAWDGLLERCRPGTNAGQLRALGAVVYGAGQGVEPWDDGFVLGPGTTCALELARPDNVHQDVVLVTADGADVLT